MASFLTLSFSNQVLHLQQDISYFELKQTTFAFFQALSYEAPRLHALHRDSFPVRPARRYIFFFCKFPSHCLDSAQFRQALTLLACR
jgi:hypothetical protein